MVELRVDLKVSNLVETKVVPSNALLDKMTADYWVVYLV